MENSLTSISIDRTSSSYRLLEILKIHIALPRCPSWSPPCGSSDVCERRHRSGCRPPSRSSSTDDSQSAIMEFRKQKLRIPELGEPVLIERSNSALSSKTTRKKSLNELRRKIGKINSMDFREEKSSILNVSPLSKIVRSVFRPVIHNHEELYSRKNVINKMIRISHPV